MVSLQAEPDGGGEALGDGVEQVTGDVLDPAAAPAAHMQVRAAGQAGREVVDDRAVRRMDVGDQAEVAECLHGPVDRGPVQAGDDHLGAGEDVLDGQVLAGLGQHAQHGTARRGHPLAARPQPRDPGRGESRPVGAQPRGARLVHDVHLQTTPRSAAALPRGAGRTARPYRECAIA